MEALCACKTDERTVNGNIRAGESLPRNVEDEKSPENMGGIGAEWVKHGAILGEESGRGSTEKMVSPGAKTGFNEENIKSLGFGMFMQFIG